MTEFYDRADFWVLFVGKALLNCCRMARSAWAGKAAEE